ncbi:hypothetical protein llap_9350 [Limosa lapponica baueri]|uniref:Uncharacterized protein n=1 Tax=Limosa lapponica baueri TaxID=1758121 RepID=A0A2I0U2V0_LIMLA|nr:hypothetical protein llap_9350 [Limosa lapponica baueri]
MRNAWCQERAVRAPCAMAGQTPSGENKQTNKQTKKPNKKKKEKKKEKGKRRKKKKEKKKKILNKSKKRKRERASSKLYFLIFLWAKLRDKSILMKAHRVHF